MLQKRLLLFTTVIFFSCCIFTTIIFFSYYKNVEQKISVNIECCKKSFDPREGYTIQDLNKLSIFWEGLFRMEESGPVPAIVESYKISQDGKTYTFVLKNSFWNNGVPLVAEDFVKSWKKVLSPNYDYPHTNLLFHIKNGKKVKNGLLPPSLLGLHAKDLTLTVILEEEPVPNFLKMLTLPIYYPVNQRLDKLSPNWGKNNIFVSNGPFEVSAHNEDKLFLKKNPYYWDSEHVKLEKIVVTKENPDWEYLEPLELPYTKEYSICINKLFPYLLPNPLTESEYEENIEVSLIHLTDNFATTFANKIKYKWDSMGISVNLTPVKEDLYLQKLESEEYQLILTHQYNPNEKSMPLFLPYKQNPKLLDVIATNGYIDFKYSYMSR